MGDESDSFIGDIDGVRLLDYERDLLAKTLPASTLFVVASGLGLERLFLEHLILYSDRRLLAFVLNTNQHDENFFISKLKEHNVSCEPKIINSEVSIKDRQSIYLEGGVQFCSSRVILVDLLQNRIPVKSIAAIFVYRAHQTLSTFQDSFILRLYREKKPDGLVKGFTDSPMAVSSLGQLQRLVDRLYIRHVELLPRFSSIIENELKQHHLHSSLFSVDVAPPLRRIHRSIVEFIKVCVKDLRLCSNTGKQTGEVNEELVHVPWATTMLEARLRNRRGHVTEKQSRLLNDASSLREILQMSENLDAATVLSRLLAMRSDKQVLEEHSGWLISPSFSRIIEDLHIICGIYDGKGTFSKFSAPIKWCVLSQVLQEIKEIRVRNQKGEDDDGKGSSVLVVTNSEEVSRQLTDVIKYGMSKTKWMTWRQLGHKCGPSPEDEPMWPQENISQLIRSQLDAEPKNELIANVQKSQKTVARAAQKRRKAAEELSSNTHDSRIQTSIVQFGILQYKRKRSEVTGDSSSTSEEIKKEVVDDDCQPSTSQELRTVGELENAELIVTSFDRERYTLLKLLEQKRPCAIIVYTMTLTILRQIELYQVSNPTFPVQVYCLQYRESTEENRYLESLNREALAFESLIREQGSLLIQREFNVEREEPPRLRNSTRDGGGVVGRMVDPRDREDQDEMDRPMVIVDMREFNSELPTILYTKGYDVVAATLEIGDYILSPDIAVERKALDDLTQSLQSGRVFKQIEQMLEYYECTLLLIESNAKFEQKIVNGGPFQGELSRHCREVRSRLCALVRAHPKMKCAWTLSPANSAEFFIELKLNAPEPNVEVAVAFKADQMGVIPEEENESQTSSQGKKDKRKPNATILRALTTHFDLKNVEAQNLMLNSSFKSLAELFSSTTSSDDLKVYIPEPKAQLISELTTYDFR